MPDTSLPRQLPVSASAIFFLLPVSSAGFHPSRSPFPRYGSPAAAALPSAFEKNLSGAPPLSPIPRSEIHTIASVPA